MTSVYNNIIKHGLHWLVLRSVTSWMASDLLPMMRRQRMMFSSSISWNDDNNGWESTTATYNTSLFSITKLLLGLNIFYFISHEKEIGQTNMLCHSPLPHMALHVLRWSFTHTLTLSPKRYNVVTSLLCNNTQWKSVTIRWIMVQSKIT